MAGRRKNRRNGWTMDAPYYPFAAKEEQYGRYSAAELEWARQDAVAARDVFEDSLRQLGMQRVGAGTLRQAEQVAGWYADDVHTILAEMRRRGLRKS